MKALVTETFTPPDQEGKENPKSYRIKPLTSWQLTELLTDGSERLKEGKGFAFNDVKFLLNHGLEDPSIIEDMPSAHHAHVANAIYTKAILREDELKKS